MPPARNRTEPNAEQSLSSRAWDGLIVFFYKTVIPLIPILAVFFLASHILNMEITGTYRGHAEGYGELLLDIFENKDSLTGSLRLGRKRFQIVEGKMLNDRNMEIRLRQQGSESIAAVGRAGTKMESIYKPASESGIPEDISGLSIEPKYRGPELRLNASKDQNELSGTIVVVKNPLKFTAARNSFSAFFGRRWLDRLFSCFGSK